MPNYYPILLDVRGRKAIVIGGNDIAAEKAKALCASGAHVTVVSPEFCPELQLLAQQEQLCLRAQPYEPGILAGAFVVVAAVNEPELIEAIWQEAQQRGQLLNIVDVPARCNFILPSILRRGQLTIAVSTEGASPGLAKRIRQQLEALFPPAYSLYIRLAARARNHLRRHAVSYAQRDTFFGDYFDSEVLYLLEHGNEAEAASVTAQLLARHAITVAASQLQKELSEEP
jgi:precorrin-2 dehydrogenase/sirohydrochlorin ferrochelatase